MRSSAKVGDSCGIGSRLENNEPRYCSNLVKLPSCPFVRTLSLSASYN